MEWGLIVLIGISAYLLGSFPSGVVMARLWGKEDPRLRGSGHTGGLNIWRIAGLVPAALTVILDMGKGVTAILLAQRLLPQYPWAMAMAGTLAVVGHNWSVFAGFKGGVGLAALAAIFLYLYFPAVFLAVLIWAILYFIIRHPPRTTMALVVLIPFVLWALRAPPYVVLLCVGAGTAVFIKEIPDFHRRYGDEKEGS